jgi:predicted nucleic acid-binding protein
MAAKMNGLLLDTTVLIDLSRGNEQAADFIEQQRQMQTYLAISAVSAMELVVGCRNKREVTLAQLLIAEFDVIPLSAAISAQAYHWLIIYSRSHGLLIPDALIGATAVVTKLELATDNIKDFKMLPDLQWVKAY